MTIDAEPEEVMEVCNGTMSTVMLEFLPQLYDFFFNFVGHMPIYVPTDIPCFGLLVMCPLSFKARMESLSSRRCVD